MATTADSKSDFELNLTDHPLGLAIASKDESVLKKSYINTSCLLETHDQDDTPLSAAVKLGFTEGVSYILESIKAEKNETENVAHATSSSSSTFNQRQSADKKISNEDCEVVINFILRRNKDEKRINELMLAAIHDHLEILKLILKHDKNNQLLLAVDSEGKNVFHHAVSNGNCSIMQYLIKHHNENHQLTRSICFDGSNGLHLAAINGFPKTFNTLFDEEPELLQGKLHDGTTVLMSAASNHKELIRSAKVEMIQLIIKLDPKQILSLSKKGSTVIHKLNFSEQIDIECLCIFLEELLSRIQANPQVLFNKCVLAENVFRNNVIVFQAIAAELVEKFGLLDKMKKFSKLQDLQNKEKSLPSTSMMNESLISLPNVVEIKQFFEAVNKNDSKKVKAMLDINPELINAGKDSKTAILLASELGYNKLLELLLKYDTDNIALYARTNQGYNAAMLAAKNGHVACLACLFQVDRIGRLLLNVDKSNGLNILQIAVLNGQLAVWNFLINLGEPFVFLIYGLTFGIDSENRTIAHIALSKQNIIFTLQLLNHFQFAFTESTKEDAVTQLMLTLVCSHENLNPPLLELIDRLLLDFHPKLFHNSSRSLIALRNKNKQNERQDEKESRDNDILPKANFIALFELCLNRLNQSYEDSYNEKLAALDKNQKKLELAFKDLQQKLNSVNDAITKYQAKIFPKVSNDTTTSMDCTDDLSTKQSDTKQNGDKESGSGNNPSFSSNNTSANMLLRFSSPTTDSQLKDSQQQGSEEVKPKRGKKRSRTEAGFD